MKKITLIKRKVERLVFYPVSIIIRIAFKYIPKFRKLRLGVLSTKGRESLLISYLEPYLRQLQSDSNTDLNIVVVNPTKEKEYSQQLLKMYKREIVIIDRKSPILVYLLSILYELLPDSSVNKVVLKGSTFTKEFQDIWSNYKTPISLSYKETQLATSLQRKRSIDSKKDFICLGVREDSYYKHIAKLGSSYRPISKQSFSKNPDIDTYVKSLEKIVSDKMYVFRMGLYLNNKINTHSKYFIDQANFEHSDLLDIHMFSNCKFVVSGASGIQWFAALFNKPVLVADAYPFVGGGGVNSKDIYIPQLVWSAKERRLLFFSEIINLGKKLYYKDFLRSNQLELIKNSEDEIYEGCMEIICNIDNNQYPIDNEKVNKLSSTLSSLKERDSFNLSQYNGKISSYFLTKYEQLAR